MYASSSDRGDVSREELLLCVARYVLNQDMIAVLLRETGELIYVDIDYYTSLLFEA